MDLYFFVYGVIFLTILGDCLKISLNAKKIIMAFDIIWLTLFFGLRWECGTDWVQYYNIFDLVSWDNFYNFHRYGEQNVEVGFAFVNVLLKTIGMGSYTFYLLVTNLIRFILMAYTSFKLSKYPIVTFFGFLSLQYFFPTRNPFATALFFVAFVFILDRKIKPYILWWLSACSIHISSVVMVPLYWLYGLRLSYIWQILIYFVSIAFERIFASYIKLAALYMNFGSGTFTEKVEAYTHVDSYDGSRSFIQYALPLFFLTLFAFIRKRIFLNKIELKKYDFYVVCYLLSLVILNIFQYSLPDLTRYCEFINTWPLLIPFVVQYFKKFRFMVVFIIIAYYTYRLNNSINYNEYREMFIPYNSIMGKF